MSISNKTLELFKKNFKSVDFIQSGINDNKDGYVNYIISITKCNRNEAIEIIQTYDLYIKPPTSTEIAHNNAVARELLNKPKCPTCGSQNVQKIGGLERAGSVAILGAFSNKINKSFKCNNCGYTW